MAQHGGACTVPRITSIPLSRPHLPDRDRGNRSFQILPMQNWCLLTTLLHRSLFKFSERSGDSTLGMGRIKVGRAGSGGGS